MLKEKILKNQIRAHRFNNGEMTQEDLAQQVGASRQTVIAIEKGNYNPSVTLALEMARVFRVPVEKIFSLEEKS